MRLVWATLLGGLFAGALDIIFAFVFYGLTLGASEMQILQSVAAGLIGREEARAGGWGSALIGLGCHFFIATAMAAVFVVAARLVPLLVKRAWIFGILYGFALYAVMTYVVVPASALGPRPAPEGLQLWGALFTHVFFVGVPIALVARRFSA
ncbi:MAG: hypothetical protein JNJ73_16025 [Hyphomonadaceae bacterium]|nr:hypothetical protein [Hyphomonadaceae bacterium]